MKLLGDVVVFCAWVVLLLGTAKIVQLVFRFVGFAV
jgi:hypothetical protein